jgi:hypothetical protein
MNRPIISLIVSLQRAIVLAILICVSNPFSLWSKSCKTFDSLVVKCAIKTGSLTVCGTTQTNNLVVCGNTQTNSLTTNTINATSINLSGDIIVGGDVNNGIVSIGQLLGFGHFYNSQPGSGTVDVPGTVPSGQDNRVPFEFDNVPPMGFAHGTAPFTDITLINSGIYIVGWYVRITMASSATSLALFKNGTQVSASDTFAFFSAGTLMKFAIFTANAGDVINLRNLSTDQIHLGGGNSGSTVAEIQIVRLS